MAESRLDAIAARGSRSGSTCSRATSCTPASSKRMVDEDAVTGLTSNPSIFQKAIAGGGDYDEQISQLPREHRRPARDLLRARDRRRARRLRRAPPGLGPDRRRRRLRRRSRSTRASPSTRRRPSSRRSTCTSGSTGRTSTSRSRRRARACRRSRTASPPGIPINVTLIFSLERYGEVVDAYQRGVARLVESGGDPSKVTSVASFFVSRLDTEADARLEALGETGLEGKLGIANAKLAYKHFAEAFAGAEWERLAAAGATRRSARSGPPPRRRTRPTATSCTSRS